jgi:hypothetical protein
MKPYESLSQDNTKQNGLKKRTIGGKQWPTVMFVTSNNQRAGLSSSIRGKLAATVVYIVTGVAWCVWLLAVAKVGRRQLSKLLNKGRR